MSSGSPEPAGPEYYIRGINDTEARGPFSRDQLASLAESNDATKGVTPDTYYYDTATEQWLTIGSNAELKALIWPEKKKMGFKQKEFKVVNEEKADSAPAITVQDFLAAAEGKTDETKGKKDKGDMMMIASQWGTRAAAVISLLSAVALILPGIDALMAMDVAKLIDKPFVILGVADVLIGVLLLLGVIDIYPIVRFRAAFGLGFLGFFFMTQGQLTPMIAVGAGAIGLYFCTIFLSYIPLAVAALLGLGGMAMLATMSYS
ncbi:MAG: hypothetical protein PSW75_11095 [bacterium]|nr:hypothetical protein [bacterium]MDI1334882.1 hypothetical protein [Lacunisphaera sp.]